MGVDTRLVVYATDERAAAGACRAAFERLAELEDIMSDYRPTSELMRLCARAGGPAVPVSADLYRVLSFGQRVARESGGAFDMTVGPLSRLWRAARKSHQLPPADALARARALTGYQNLILDEGGDAGHTARLVKEGMILDLGGIAKGDAGDQAIRTLRAHGIRSALYQAGGDIVVSDPPPGTEGWVVSIPHGAGDRIGGKRDEREKAPPTTAGTSMSLRLSNCAVSTSGDSNQYLEINGTRYSHLLNPHTGLGLTSRTLVTVIAPQGLMSDPLSKAASILPPEEFGRLLRRYPHVTAYARRLPLGG